MHSKKCKVQEGETCLVFVVDLKSSSSIDEA